MTKGPAPSIFGSGAFSFLGALQLVPETVKGGCGKLEMRCVLHDWLGVGDACTRLRRTGA